MIQHSLPSLFPSEIEEVDTLLATGMLANGKNSAKFRSKLSEIYESGSIHLTNSGSSALYMALKILRTVKSEVILPSYVCQDVLNSVRLAGFVPVLCDLESDWNVGSNTISAKITKDTAAIIITHTFGIYCDFNSLKSSNIPIIEDCCQAFGSPYENSIAGTYGDITVFSFNATKYITSAEGGAILINTPEIVHMELVPLYEHAFRMSDLQAVIGLNQIQYFNYFFQKRKEIASIYFYELNQVLTNRFYGCRERTNFFRFPIFVECDFYEFQAHLNSCGITVRKGVDKLLHREFKLGYDREFPETVKVFKKTVSIPIYPNLGIETAKFIAKSINQYFNEI